MRVFVFFDRSNASDCVVFEAVTDAFVKEGVLAITFGSERVVFPLHSFYRAAVMKE